MTENEKKMGGREYLQEVRPEAMGHLLAFYKESGKHLDPKTRFLISVVTKVINFTPRGLKQYIKRAMQAGATRDEVIDAILLSYPCAGLTRVVDSIDVLREMDLPDDSPKEKQWHKVDLAGPIAEGEAAAVVVDGRAILIARVEGKLHALDGVCPHQGGDLTRGKYEKGVVICPRHEWGYRVADGACLKEGGAPAVCHPVRETDGLVEVCL